jgi:hypothetical protein
MMILNPYLIEYTPGGLNDKRKSDKKINQGGRGPFVKTNEIPFVKQKSRPVVDASVPAFVGLDAEKDGLVHVKYVSLVCEFMDEVKIKEAIHELRVRFLFECVTHVRACANMCKTNVLLQINARTYLR